MNFSYFLELVWFQSLTALAFGDPEACILVFSFSSFHLSQLGALPPPSCPARSISPCRRALLSASNECPAWCRASSRSSHPSLTLLMSSSPLWQDGGPHSRFALKTIQGDERLAAALWACWLVPNN